MLLQFMKEHRNAKDIETLLSDGSDPNAIDVDGNNALHYWTRNKHSDFVDVAKVLIKYKTDVNLHNKEGYTPLMLCLKNGSSTEMVTLLLDNYAQVARPSETACFDHLIHSCVNYKEDEVGIRLLRLFVNSGYDLNALDVFSRGTPLITFVRNKCNTEMIRLLLDNGAEINCTDSFSCSALHYCTRYRSNEALDILKILLDYNVDINIKNSCGETPLTTFILSDCSLDMIALLLEGDADPNSRNHSGKTVLHYCSRYNGFRVVELIKLLTQYNADINAKSDTGTTPLVQFILEDNDILMVKSLLQSGADPNARDNTGDNALHVCTKYKGIESLNFAKLLVEYGTDINAINDIGMTPLMTSIKNNCNVNLTTFLLKAGADPNVESANGETALHICSKFNDDTGLGIVQALLENNANVNAVDRGGETVLMRFIKKSNCQRIIKALLDSDANIALIEDRVSCHNYLHKCANFSEDYYGSFLVQLFIEGGYSVNVKDENDGETPLISFVRNSCSADMIELLLAAGADTNAVAKNGNTALHYYTNYQNRNRNYVLRLLVKYNANVNIVDNLGETPLMKFLSTGSNETIVQILVDAGGTITAPTDCILQKDVIHSCANYGKYLAEFLVDMLIENGYNVNWKSRVTQRTPLMCFLQNGHCMKLIQKLLDAGADPHCTDESGNNCLHYIDYYKSVYSMDMIKLFLDRKVNVNAVGDYRRTPLLKYLSMFPRCHNYAIDCRMVIELFLDAGADANAKDTYKRNTLHTFMIRISNDFLMLDNFDNEIARVIETLVINNADLFALCEGTKKPVELFIEKRSNMALLESFFVIIKYMLLEDEMSWEIYKQNFGRLVFPPPNESVSFDSRVSNCLKEISQFKRFEIKDGLSLLQYCKVRNPRKLGMYYRDSKVNERLNINSCPNYVKLIQTKVGLGETWSMILSRIDSMRMYNKSENDKVVMLNSYSFQYLATYLSEKDLLNVIEASNSQ